VIHVTTDQRVTLRLIDANLVPSAEAPARLGRLTADIARLGGPGVVPYAVATIQADAYRAQPEPYLIYEPLPGELLEDHLAARGAISLDETSAILARLTDALGPLHAAGLAHGALTAGSLVLHGDRLLVLDFGALAGPGPGPRGSAAPERAAGAPGDLRGDVFGVGALLYRCLTGVPAFPEGMGHAPLRMRTVAPSLPEQVDEIVQRALSRDPARRHATLAALRDEFVAAAALGHRTPQEWRYSTKKIVAVGVVVVIATVLQIALGLIQ
jgi:serine/threonine protein kinase